MATNDYFKGSNNKVYDYFAQTCPKLLDAFKGKYDKTSINQSGKSESDNSYSFISSDGNKRATLNQLFHTEISEDHWKQAVNGKGHENHRILTMHSSALLSLLFFHAVYERNPLFIQIDGKDIALRKLCLKSRTNVLKVVIRQV